MSEIVKLVKNSTFDNLVDTLNCLKISYKETDNLFMLNFNDDADFNNKIVRQANGIIFEKNSHNLVHYSFEKCYEGLSNTTDDFPVENVKKNYSIELYFDGSMIKLFFLDNKWNVATSRHLEGDKNFWASKKSFTELFSEAVSVSYNCTYTEFLDSLDKSCCYSYLLQHPENNTITSITTPVVFNINKVNLNTLQEERLEKNNITVPITLEQVINSNNNFMLFQENENSEVTRIKLLSKNFSQLKNIRGNNPNIGLTYIDYINDDEKRIQLLDLFPYHMKTFILIEKKMNTACKNIHNLYVNIHIKKLNVDIPHNYKKTIIQLHGQFKRTKTSIQLDDVYNKLYTLPTKVLAYVIDYKY